MRAGEDTAAATAAVAVRTDVMQQNTIHSSIDQSTKTQARGSWQIVTICGEAQIGYSRPALGPAAVRPEHSACLDHSLR